MTFGEILQEQRVAAEIAARHELVVNARAKISEAFAPEEESIAAQVVAFIAASGVAHRLHRSSTYTTEKPLPFEHNDLYRLSLVVELLGVHNRLLVVDSYPATFPDRWGRLVDFVFTKTGWGRITWLGYERPLKASVVERAAWLVPVRVNYCGHQVLLRWRNPQDTAKILLAIKSLLDGKRLPASEFRKGDLLRPRLLGNKYFAL